MSPRAPCATIRERKEVRVEDNTPSGAREGEATATASPSVEATVSPSRGEAALPPPPPQAPTGEAASQPPTEVSASEAPRRFMFPVKCTRCGADFEVPFNPDPNRPILCRTCRPVYPATCAMCGKERQVPFKVGAGRPYRCPSCEAKMPPLPPPPKQGKPKDPAREAAKDALRAVFKEVANNEPTSEQSSRIVALCKELYFGAADDTPSQEKKKDAGRQAAKEAMRAVFKEVGNREPTLEESASIVSLCRALFFGGGAAPVARPRAVGAQPIDAGASATPSPSPTAPPTPSKDGETAKATRPEPPSGKAAQKPRAVPPAPLPQKAAHRVVVPITQLKVAQPLQPEQLPRDVLPREGGPNVEIELVFALSSAAGKPVLPVRAMFSSRNYRRALKAIDEHGGNAVVLLQGRLTGDGELLGAGISVVPNKGTPHKEPASKAPAEKTPPPPKPVARPAAEKAPLPKEPAIASAPPASTPEKKAPVQPPQRFVVRQGERIGRWEVVRELPPKSGDRQILCLCTRCWFEAQLSVDELIASVLPLCRRCE